jgi:DNA-directed RNA polymerase subunit N (RpoN/RPB10)
MYHREYPIRCKSCNEQLACYSEEYEEYAKDYGYETALNMLGIMEPCSRYNMMNPTMILDIRENRNLIEGLKDIDLIDKFSGELSFRTCIDKITNVDYTKDEEQSESKPEGTGRALSLAVTKKQPEQKTIMSTTSKPKVTKSTFKIDIQNPIQTPKQVLIQKPIGVIEELSTKITEEDRPIDIIDEEQGPAEFLYPEVVGIPTINSSGENTKVHISGKYYAEVLSGRTYLCR